MKLTPCFAKLMAYCLAVVAAGAAANPSGPAYRTDTGSSATGYSRDCVSCNARICARAADQEVVGQAQARPHNRTQAAASKEYCAPQLGSRYFPAEEEHVAAFLNKQHYPFE